MDPESFGRFEVRRRIGHGAFATVYLCMDPDLDTMVAIKVLGENYAADEDIKVRFVQEARILRRLDSDRILRVHTIDRLADGRPYFVADYADRGTLDRLIRAGLADAGEGPAFSLDEALVLSREIARCLAVAHHQNIVHRDLKPSNILFRTGSLRSGETLFGNLPTMEEIVRGEAKMVLADFGIARALEAASGHTIAAGTPQYMAPEQADGNADLRSDLYAAAVILYELLAGRPPFAGASVVEVVRRQLTEGPPSIRSVREDVPEILDQMLLRGMSMDPERRYQSAEEWLSDLDDVASEILFVGADRPDSTVVGDSKSTIVEEPPPLPAEPPPPGAGPPPGPRRKTPSVPPLALVGGVVGILLVGVLGFLLWPRAPAVPIGLTATATPQGVLVAWEAPEEAAQVAEYQLYRDGEPIATVPGGETSYTDDEADLTAGYEYAVAATGENGRTSRPSEVVASVPLAAPEAPTGLAATVSSDSIELSWRPPADASSVTAYGIYRDGEFTSTVPGTQTSYTDDGADTSETHTYSVDAIATEEIRSAPSGVLRTEPFVLVLAAFDLVSGDISRPGQLDLYALEGEEGDFITLFVSSSVGPLFVEILGPDGESLVVSEDTADVALNLRLPSSGRYESRIGLAEEATGTYDVSYSVLTDCLVGQTCFGELEEGFIHEWTFPGTPGEVVAVTVLPDTAAPSLQLYAPDGSLLNELEGDPGSVIVIWEELVADGDYIITVGYTSGAGFYRMSVYPFFELLPRESFSGNLPGTIDEDFSDFYPFDAEAGTSVVAFMTSDTGDPLLGLFDPSDELVALSEEVDLGVAQLEADLAVSGTYGFVASFAAGSGEYTLFFDRDLPNGSVGATTTAAIAFEDEIDTYTFQATAGETVVIFMNSDTGVPNWSLWDNSTLLEEASGGGLIEYVIPTGGFYVVEASLLGGTGPYQLVIARFSP